MSVFIPKRSLWRLWSLPSPSQIWATLLFVGCAVLSLCYSLFLGFCFRASSESTGTIECSISVGRELWSDCITKARCICSAIASCLLVHLWGISRCERPKSLVWRYDDDCEGRLAWLETFHPRRICREFSSQIDSRSLWQRTRPYPTSDSRVMLVSLCFICSLFHCRFLWLLLAL